MCMYVCMYVCICVYIYIYMYIYVYVYVHMRINSLLDSQIHTARNLWFIGTCTFIGWSFFYSPDRISYFTGYYSIH